MREWWANVYRSGPEVITASLKHSTRSAADERGRLTTSNAGPYDHHLIGRIHVRLKPEGAPKRYADDVERYAWERAERLGLPPRYA